MLYPLKLDKYFTFLGIYRDFELKIFAKNSLLKCRHFSFIYVYVSLVIWF